MFHIFLTNLPKLMVSWCSLSQYTVLSPFVTSSIMYDIALSDTRNCKLKERYVSPVARNRIASTNFSAGITSCPPVTAESFGVICGSIKPRNFLNHL